MSAQPCIVIAEDDPKIADFIQRSLTEYQYEVFVGYDGEVAARLVRSKAPALLIVDIIMPIKNGLQLCRELRSEGAHLPILMLTALNSTEDIVDGLDAGADDYLVKPFQLPELLARVRALLRRRECLNEAPFLQIGDLSIDFNTKTVSRQGAEIPLTAREFRLLEYLARHCGQMKTRAEILEAVWGLHFDPGTNVVDVYVNYLRNKIDKSFDRKLFHTKVGMGYMLQA